MDLGARPSIRVRAAVIDAVRAHAERDAPRECCGLLIGDADRVEMAWAAANGADTPDTRYDVDPADHFAAVRHARSVGLAVVGAYHSHPRSAPEPSERDRAEAWAELVYLIAGPVPDEGWAVRAYCLVDGNFAERTLVIVA